MKPEEGYDKLRGGYYTPRAIVSFMTRWALRSPEDSVLEPSCGDGGFLAAAAARLRSLGTEEENLTRQITGVELDPREAAKAGEYGAGVVNGDFFSYFRDQVFEKRSFDAVLGNPPFIRYQNFDQEYREVAFDLLRSYGFHPNKLTNIWLPFLLLSCRALSRTGRLGMVIPAELFQVDYAAEARMFLSEYFDSLTLITFKQLVFEGIQQEVVLLLGERTSDRKGIRVMELGNLGELETLGLEDLEEVEIKSLDHSSEKWVKYYLSNAELTLLKTLAEDRRISPCTELFDVNVGLVSGENDFFILDRASVEAYGLGDRVEPVVSKAEQVRGLTLTEEDFKASVAAGRKVFMFRPENAPLEELSVQEQRYIALGAEKGYCNNYKCRIRKRWYIVPPSWRPDAFLIRQANLYPKIILNQAGTLVTDTLHKVRFAQGVDGAAVAAAFLNTYTLALSETIGRSYGGGVLTFEPGEIRRLRIPMEGAGRLRPAEFDSLQRRGEIAEILRITDEVLLLSGLGLDRKSVDLLHSVWDKLRTRRLNRKKSRV